MRGLPVGGEHLTLLALDAGGDVTHGFGPEGMAETVTMPDVMSVIRPADARRIRLDGGRK
jgi:hypothetical protein